MSFDTWLSLVNWKALGALMPPLLAGIYYLGKLRHDSIARRKEEYKKYIVPLIGELRTAVLNSINGVFPNNHLVILGKALSDRREMFKNCPRILKYNEKFMENYMKIFELEQKQMHEPEERPTELLRLKSWFHKQHPKNIHEI